MGALKPKRGLSEYSGRKTRHQSVDHVFRKLPQEILTEILARVGTKSLTDLYKAKLTCRDLNKAASEDYIFEKVSIDQVPTIPWSPLSDGALSLLERCERCGNPEMLYRQGMSEFFHESNVESGLDRLKKAAMKGHVKATYVYGVVLVLYGGVSKEEGLRVLASISKGKSSRGVVVNRCREGIKSAVRRMWVRNYIFGVEANDVGVSINDIIRARNCRTCNNVELNPASRWKSEDDAEDYDVLCDSCFWNYEAKLFRRMLGRY